LDEGGSEETKRQPHPLEQNVVVATTLALLALIFHTYLHTIYNFTTKQDNRKEGSNSESE
jgi:hypothetical protein